MGVPSLCQAHNSINTSLAESEDRMNQHLLKIKLTPAEYQAITAKLVVEPLSRAANYWQNIPDYLVARCPLCGATYSARLDTYNLEYWVRPTFGESVYRQYAQAINCPHFIVVHHFINLNSVMPTELPYTELGCEVPHVISVFLPDDVESYAVMHALPICRVEDDQFVPRYSLYTITYYSEDPALLIKRRWQVMPGSEVMFSRGLRTKDSWSLIKWVQAGKLQWLDPESPDLPLRTGPVEAFPYVNIQGHKEDTNIYRNGKWQDWSFLGRLRWLIRGE